MIKKEHEELLTKMLSKVGDLNFKRRVLTMLDYLDIQPGEVILDMGCGEGFYSVIFDKLYDCKVYAVDYDEKIMSLAKTRLENSPKVTLEQGDICNLRFPDNYFDKIICTEVLEHIVDDNKATQELFRVLKPSGILAVTVPNKNYPFIWDPFNKIRESLGLGHFNPLNGFWGGIWAYDHKRLYLPADLKNLLEKHGFEVSTLEALTHYGVPFNHLVLYVGKNLYTSFPVPEDVKKTMEKFDWEKEVPPSRQSLFAKLINFGFGVLKWADSFNDKKFAHSVSTMAVSAKCVKK